MEYTNLGNTDIRVSKLCVGCMSFGKAGTMHDWTLDETGTEAIVRHALGRSTGRSRAACAGWAPITWICISSTGSTTTPPLRKRWRR